MNSAYGVSITKPEDMAKSRTWVGRFFGDAANLPISFVLDGQVVSGIPAEWQPASSSCRIDANIIETVFTGHDAKSGLSVRVELWAYQDYPVVEWVTWFANTGHASTPLICDIRALDGTFAGTGAVLWHCNGDFYSEQGYTPR